MKKLSVPSSKVFSSYVWIYPHICTLQTYISKLARPNWNLSFFLSIFHPLQYYDFLSIWLYHIPVRYIISFIRCCHISVWGVRSLVYRLPRIRRQLNGLCHIFHTSLQREFSRKRDTFVKLILTILNCVLIFMTSP